MERTDLQTDNEKRPMKRNPFSLFPMNFHRWEEAPEEAFNRFVMNFTKEVIHFI